MQIALKTFYKMIGSRGKYRDIISGGRKKISFSINSNSIQLNKKLSLYKKYHYKYYVVQSDANDL